MKYLFTGGGTGGHVYPGLAIADAVRRQKPEAEFLFVGRKDKLESRVVPNHNFHIKFVLSLPFPRSRSLFKLLAFLAVISLGILQSMLILLWFRPKLIVGTGGYVSAPILLAYGILRKLRLSRSKVFLYEPNASPGLLNKVTARFADCIGVGFEQALSWFDKETAAKVGYPVRGEFIGLERHRARSSLGIDLRRKVVLVFGGSGGSRLINEALLLALPSLIRNPNIFVFHITGKSSTYNPNDTSPTEFLSKGSKVSKLTDFYRREDYVDDIKEVYAAADLIVCRGGAGTLTELGVVGRPSIVIPASIAADDHQAVNARQIEKLGAGKILYEKARWKDGKIETYVDHNMLCEMISDMLADKGKLEKMSDAALSGQQTDSLNLIIELLEQIIHGHKLLIPDNDDSLRSMRLPIEPNKMLRWVEDRIEECGGLSELPRGEMGYYLYQADKMLASSEWLEIPLGVRNVGVKMVGLLNYQDHRSTLLQILMDKKPVSILKRSLGGDYLHTGILRRNVIERGLAKLGQCNRETQQAVEQSLLKDPYFEVRAAAAKFLGQQLLPDSKSEDVFLLALMDVSPVVKVEVLAALGGLASGSTVLKTVKKYYQHSNWMIRMAVVETLKTAYERGEIEVARLKSELEQIHSISTHFEPNFLLANLLRDLTKQVLSSNEK